jgi:hypothetical protein
MKKEFQFRGRKIVHEPTGINKNRFVMLGLSSEEEVWAMAEDLQLVLVHLALEADPNGKLYLDTATLRNSENAVEGLRIDTYGKMLERLAGSGFDEAPGASGKLNGDIDPSRWVQGNLF